MAEPQAPTANLSKPSRAVSPWPGWIGLFVLAFALYAATANRGAQWQDSGLHILRAVTGESTHPLGLALAHPLHHWVSRFVVRLGVLEPCFAVTLVSALAAAATVANTYGCVLALTRRRSAGLLAAGSLAFANTFWHMATLAETYTLAAALLSAECWCLVCLAQTGRRTYLWATLLCNGLGIANHMLAALTVPVLAVIVVQSWRSKRVRGRDVFVAIGLWLLGSLPYTAMVVGQIMRTGDFGATVQSALFGKSFAGDVLNTRLTLRMLFISAGFVALNFPNFLLPAAVFGTFRAKRIGVPPFVRGYLLGALLLNVWFVVRYTVVDSHTFFLPTYMLLSVLGGTGFAVVLAWPRRRLRGVIMAVGSALLLMTPVLYAFTPAIARRLHVLDSVAHHKPYRDDYVYLFTPWSVVETSAERMSRHAATLADDRGLILVEDTMAEFAISYQAIRLGTRDLQVTHDISAERITQALNEGRAIVLVPKNVDAPRTEPPTGFWKRDGDLYILSTGQSEP